MSYPRYSSLRRYPDFLKLWVGQSFSQLGSQVSLIAVPLTAVMALGASPAEVRLLRAAESLPVLLVGLFAGAWVDRMRGRRILIAADIGRALVLLLIPLAGLTKSLRIELLYAVTFLVGVLTVFFDVAYASFLPSLVRRDQLVDANSTLEATNTGARIVGPSLAGVLVTWLTAPVAISIDSLSFGLSALLTGWIRQREEAQGAPASGAGVVPQIAEGLRFVVRSPLLRALVATTGTWALFDSVTLTVLVLFVIRQLGAGPAALGLVYTGIWVGFFPGTLLVTRTTQRFGLGPTMVAGATLSSVGGALTPLAGGPRWLAIGILFLAMFLLGLGAAFFSINEVSLRQAVTPDGLLGRVNATARVLTVGATPLGALLGGVLGGSIGLRPTLVVAAAGSFLGFLWVWFSPVRVLRDQPAHLAEPPGSTP